LSGANPYFFLSLNRHLEEISSQATERDALLSFSLPWYAWRNAKSSLVMNFTIEFFRTRPNDEAHATLDRISIVAENLDTATVKAKSLFDTLDMPQKPDGLRILDQVKRELFVWVPDAQMPKCKRQEASLVTVAADDTERSERTSGCRRMQGRVHFSKASRSAESSLPTRSWRTLFRYCHPIPSIG
jgi:hypothetical protein